MRKRRVEEKRQTSCQSKENPVLQVRDLTVEFSGTGGRSPVLRNISFALHRGEVLGLVGESGAGKSLLARTLLRLEAPARIAAGSLRFAGRELTDLPEREMRRYRGRQLTMVVQNPGAAFDPLFTLRNQFREAASLYGNSSADRKARLQEIYRRLEEMGIADPHLRSRQYPHEWSRGMLQRAQLAVALSANPSLLILDEVTSALDPTAVWPILHALSILKREGNTAVLFITHDLAVAAQVCDRVAVMRQGEIVEQGAVAAILSRPQHPYTRLLLAAAQG